MHTEQVKINSIQRFESKAKLTLSNSQVYYLPIEAIITHQLVEAVVLTESQVEIIVFEGTLFETFAKAKQYLAMRDHSTGELKMKLKKKRFPDETISQTLTKCQKLGYIDDEKYAYKLAEKLVAKKPCGKPFLMAYLQTKLIPRDIGDRISTMIFESQDIQTLAMEALEKKWVMYDQLELEDARNKSYNYLARRGFSFGEAKDAFEDLYNKKQEELDN